MGRKPKKKPPSFCTILLNDFTNALKIPCGFVNKYLKGEVIEKPVLKTPRSSKVWAIKMHKIDGNYFFKSGWSDFVRDNNLERGDVLLIFWLFRRSTFSVTIFDPTCCVKKPFNMSTTSSTPLELHCDNEKKVSTEEDTNGGITINPCCVATITKNTINNIYLAAAFVRETGVLLKENHTVLRNEEGRKWRVETRLRNNGHNFELTNGWNDFRNENGLKLSDICSFEFCHEEGNLIDVRVLNINYNETGSTKNCANKKLVRRGRKTKIPYFVNTINRRNTHMMGLGIKFVRETKVLSKKNCTVLRDEEGRKWEVGISKIGGAYKLVHGWNEFRDANGLKIWDLCLFEFRRDEGNLIDFCVLRRDGGKTHGS